MNKLIFKTEYLNSLLPTILLLLILMIWELLVEIKEIPSYILPAPTFIFKTLINDWSILFPAMINTLEIALVGFVLAGNIYH